MNQQEQYTPDDDNEFYTDRQVRRLRRGRPFLVVLMAVLVLGALSLVPWGSLTGNYLKDYNLLADIVPSEPTDSVDFADEDIDPALQEAMAMEPAETQTDLTTPEGERPRLSQESSVGDNLESNDRLEEIEYREVPSVDNIVDGQVIIEDYTPGQTGLSNLRRAIGNRGSRPARIAFIGDSYIEGDIITQDLRRKMQAAYGGRGVGYMPAHSIVQGFRNTVRHTNSGWRQHAVGETSKSNYMTLQGEYYTGTPGATVTYKGVSQPNLSSWGQTKMLFIAPDSGTITMTTSDGSEHVFDIEGSPSVQAVLLPAETSQVKITSTVPGLKLLGTWLEDASGVVVDNMSLRGYSGISHRNLNASLAAQTRQYVDYDLIIVEYGINALSAKQRDYSNYQRLMTGVLQRVKQCYPNADILLMGIGDRGQKINGEPRSLPTVPYMIDAQRQAAKQAGVLFWDTRQAMGGENAIVRWREQKLANADYIHLNSQGGRRLADLIYEALKYTLNN